MLELALISASGIWLGLFALLSLVLLVVSIEKDNSALGSAVLVITFAIAEFGFNIPIWDSIVANPFILIFYLIVYIAVGSLYATLWRLPNFLRKNSSSIQADYNNWKKANQWGSDNNKRDVSFDAFLNSSSYQYKVKNSKDRIASWVMLWPAGVLWELMHKPFRWIWDTTYRIRCKDGSYKIYHDQGKVCKWDAKGDPIYAKGSVLNINEME
jgi:hypothetical protein